MGKIVMAVLGVLIGAAAVAADNDNLIGLKTQNGRIVAAWIDLAFNQHKMAEAFDKYVSRDNFVSHSVYNASTKQRTGFEEERAREIRIVAPDTHFEIVQILAQGDLVVAHIHASHGADKIGDEVVEIMRVKNGKIVDHWPMHAALKDDSRVFVDLDH